jgi:hypothetical protein
VPPPVSSLTPGPKFRRGIYRSVTDINERPEPALAAVLDRIKTPDELLRTASQVKESRSRDTRFSGFAGFVDFGEQLALGGSGGGLAAAAAAEDEGDAHGEHGTSDRPGDVDPVAGEGGGD